MKGATRLSLDDLRSICRSFGLRVEHAEVFTGGIDNTNAVVTTPHGRFVVQVLERREHRSGEAYASFLDELGRAGVAVPHPRRRDDGSFTVDHRGRPAVVLGYVEGACGTRLGPLEVEHVGGVLAIAHRSNVLCPFPPVHRLTAEDLIALSSVRDAAFRDWVSATHDRTRSVVDATSPSAPIHGDPFPDNVVVRPDGSVTLIDWDDAAQDSPLIDLGMAILGLCGPRRFAAERAASLLRGYRSAGGDAVDLHLLLATTSYVGAVTAVCRYRREVDDGVLPAADRSYEDMLQLVGSVERDWAAIAR